ncbi:uncharacterized protein LOC127839212 [Dreissena polymorpha]|uniref:uncharacterized protein LOC127839212 n=1 Tax=Dreissena polymorpha TaxID=45954 RepID=UPI002264FF53|nr:uncharacterized protein LOC127839212 [Dreissena polymorpha]
MAFKKMYKYLNIIFSFRQCVNVTLISELVKGPTPDLQQLSRKLQTILETLKKLENNWNCNMQSLPASYTKQLHEIRQTRQKINAILDEMEKTTINELDERMTSLKASIKTDVDNCNKIMIKLKQLGDVIHDIVDKGKAELTFIASKKCLEKIKQSETYLKKNTVLVESSLTFQADINVLHYLTGLSGLGKVIFSTKVLSVLGDPDQVFKVQGKSEYDVSLPSDTEKSFNISAICVLSDDQILVADFDNKQVKLLNHQYQVVGHCDLTGYPLDMCHIASGEVAVAVDDDKTHEVQFVLVNDGRLVKGRKLQFEHGCYGIAHDGTNLYLTTGTALFKHSLTADLFSKVYEDTSGRMTVSNCAVSPLGDKIFVTSPGKSRLLTLARAGKVLHTFRDPDLHGRGGIHVTAQGQVLVCGFYSDTVLQLDGDGKKKLATLATRKDGLDRPWSVFYNRRTESIIVGQYDSKILVYKV